MKARPGKRSAIRGTQYGLLGLVALAVAVLAWLLWPKAPAPLRASLVAAELSPSTFVRAEGPRPFVFPDDRGPHEDYQTEWWYYTGNLTAETGEHFGYQLTFFRRALTPPDQRTARDSAWATDQVYMAHFALTDVAGNRHYSFERLARGAAAALRGVGIAGAQGRPYRVWLEDWEVAAAGTADAPAVGPVRLRASASQLPAVGPVTASPAVTADLILTDRKGPVLQGDRGYSRKGPEAGNASYYYSLTRLVTEGTVTVGGRSFTVSGLSWMDQEWSTSALGADQVGWDWFSIQLDDRTELMVFHLRRADGGEDAFSSGTLVAADGTTQALGPGDFTIEPVGRWRSPRTGGEYPSGWMLVLPGADLRLEIRPWLADQEMQTSSPYWEGAVRVTGTAAGRPVAGNGYVELTGYAGSMQGQF